MNANSYSKGNEYITFQVYLGRKPSAFRPGRMSTAKPCRDVLWKVPIVVDRAGKLLGSGKQVVMSLVYLMIIQGVNQPIVI
ncbi:MAG: hypothetical protein O4805_05510 [Trichodesmium sp. St16_bin2-tuft]|nr:hypothetical protein [Trichodesmium sp. St16_bin2-tuft]